MHRFSIFRDLRPIGVLVFSLLLAGCASAPVQEMSDARQAIEAAEHVDARANAPEFYFQAKEHLKAAEFALQTRDYGVAREEATLAKTTAIKARETALERTGSP